MIQKYSCAKDSKLEIVEVDTKAQTLKGDMELFPWLYTVFINSDLEKISSTSQDIQTFKQLLTDKLAKEGVYAGCKTTDSWYEIYFYLKSAKGIEIKIRDVLNNFDCTFEANAVKDKSWKFYKTQLLPDRYQQHHIQNRQIIDELIDAGDDTTKDREVEHYIVFDTNSLRAKFCGELGKNSLTCKNVFDDDGYYVTLSHMQNLDFVSMCEFIDNLVSLSDRFHAKYIGWSSKLAKDD